MMFPLPRDLLKLAVGGVLMVFAAAVHSPMLEPRSYLAMVKELCDE